MRASVIHALLLTAIAAGAPAYLSGAAAQGHQHPPKPQGPPEKPATAPKPAAGTEKPNRPKPENQPGAVMNAEKLAASHADHHEMTALEGGGVLPDGWHHRFDLPGMKLEHLRVMKHGDDMHVTSGPPGIYYNPAMTASGSYVVKGTFNQLAKGAHREGYGPFVGGTELAGEKQRYLYFLVRQDGRYLIKERDGVNTRGIVDWTQHAAIKPFGADGRMTNELAIEAGSDTIRFLINGVEVARQPRAKLPADGIVGLRINHQLDVLIEDLSIVAAGSR